MYIVGRTEEKLQEVAERYGKNTPGQIIPLAYDVSKKDQIEALYKDFHSREKCCCVLINNAGIMGGTYQTEASSAEEMKKNLFDNSDATVDEWTGLYKTLVAQIYFMTTAFLPLLAHSTQTHPGYSGTVINIASISGMVKIFQHHPAYNTAKAAAIHLGRMLASEIANNNLKIRVNTISPGVFPSEMTAGDSDDAQKSHIEKQKYEGKVPAARPGKDEDMASAILFCVANQYLNGQNIVVDGGYTLAAGL